MLSGTEEKGRSCVSYACLLLFHRLEYFNNTPLLVLDIDALKDLTILSSPNLPYHFVVVLIPAQGSSIFPTAEIDSKPWEKTN